MMEVISHPAAQRMRETTKLVGIYTSACMGLPVQKVWTTPGLEDSPEQMCTVTLP